MPSSERQPQPRGSLRGAAGRLLLFLLPVALAWAGLEYATARIPTLHSLKRQRLLALSGKIDTLILGSSSANHGLAPKEMSGVVFNFALVSQPLYYDDRFLTWAVPLLPRLKRVIIQIEYTSLPAQLYDSPENWRQYSYELEFGFPPARQRDWLDIRMFSRVALRTPQYYRQSLVPALAALAHGRNGLMRDENLDAMDDRGWCIAPVRLDPARLDAAVTLAYHNSYWDRSHRSENLTYLRHMLSLLRDRHIDTVLVTLPVWRTYLAGIRPAEWSSTQAVMREMTGAYGARYFSFFDRPDFDPEDFYDSNHLSARGAVRFTRLLNARLEAPPGN